MEKEEKEEWDKEEVEEERVRKVWRRCVGRQVMRAASEAVGQLDPCWDS